MALRAQNHRNSPAPKHAAPKSKPPWPAVQNEFRGRKKKAPPCRAILDMRDEDDVTKPGDLAESAPSTPCTDKRCGRISWWLFPGSRTLQVSNRNLFPREFVYLLVFLNVFPSSCNSMGMKTHWFCFSGFFGLQKEGPKLGSCVTLDFHKIVRPFSCCFTASKYQRENAFPPPPKQKSAKDTCPNLKKIWFEDVR